MQLRPIFPLEILGLDQPGLEEAGYERAGTGERVEDMDAFVGDGGAVKVFDEKVVDGPVDEVDDLDGGVDDPERVGGFGEGFAEELLVQFGDDPLTAISAVDTADEHPDVLVEPFERAGFGFEVLGVEDVQHVLHHLGDGVAGREVGAFEEGFEHGAGDEVLGEHAYRVIPADPIVQRLPERCEERVETFDGVGVLVGVVEQGADAGFLGRGDSGDVAGPGFHVGTVADLLDDPGVQRIAPFVKVREVEGARGCLILCVRCLARYERTPCYGYEETL